MDKIVIKGNKRLVGEAIVSGSKNSILPLMFSCLLIEGKHVFHNVPNLKDVKTSCLLLKYLGCDVYWQGRSLIIHHKKLKTSQAPYHLVCQMRAGILALGPLLARLGSAAVSLPGGCAIGTRAVNWHLKGLEQMGVQIKIKGGHIIGKCNGLNGARILMDFPSVGATENLMMAACLAKDVTIIENAAREPEIVDLAQYLVTMGANIQGAGTSVIKICPNSSLKSAEHTVIPDRIEAGTLLLAGAITYGEVYIKKCLPLHLDSLILKLRQSGYDINIHSDTISLCSPKFANSIDIVTAPYPGFPTDLQAQFMALLTQTEGSSVVKETIFENRFMHVQELARFGADIYLNGCVARVKGPCALQGAPVTATDLRASACLILAGLAAKGESIVHRVYHLDRGYEYLEKKLSCLGANIKRQ